MTADLSFVTLILGASLPVQLVLLLLLLASLLSWAAIFDRWRVLGKASREAGRFERPFWGGGDLGKLYREVERQPKEPIGMASVFTAGFREFVRLRDTDGMDPTTMVEGARRAMHVALSREMDRLEQYLSLLATVGSTSPYVGLFGTVWGIMISFMALGNVKQATLSMVAPGIAEALIATAMGLFAAIPAVVAYNRFANDVERLHGRYDDFSEEFTNILQRRAHRS